MHSMVLLGGQGSQGLQTRSALRMRDRRIKPASSLRPNQEDPKSEALDVAVVQAAEPLSSKALCLTRTHALDHEVVSVLRRPRGQDVLSGPARSV